MSVISLTGLFIINVGMMAKLFTVALLNKNEHLTNEYACIRRFTSAGIC